MKGQEFPEKTGRLSEDTLAQVWFSGQNDSLHKYIPEESVLSEIIKKVNKDTHAELIVGTWCEDSYILAPQMISTLEKAGIPFKLTGLDRSKKCPFNPNECTNWDIINVPTLKLYQGETLLGVIVEYPKRSVEEDLLDLLNSN